MAAPATYMPADLVLLSLTWLLFKHAYWLSAAARGMLAGLWPLNQHACRPFVTKYCMSAGVVLLYLLYLLVWCLTISHICWYGVSLSAVPCWCGTSLKVMSFCFDNSLSAMPVNVVPHYRSCLLGWCLTVGHAFWCGASL